MSRATNGYGPIEAHDVERRPAQTATDTTWARARFAMVRAIWQHAAAVYGPAWAARLHVLFAEGAPVLRHPDGDGVKLEALRRWIAQGGADRG